MSTLFSLPDDSVLIKNTRDIHRLVVSAKVIFASDLKLPEGKIGVGALEYFKFISGPFRPSSKLYGPID